MEIIELKERENLTADPKAKMIYARFKTFLKEINEKNLPDETVRTINQKIEELNAVPVSGNSFKRPLLKKQQQITKLLEQGYKIVPKNYYRNLWLVLGMSVFGIPIGAAYGASMGNMGLLSIGLPIGMAIGIAVGSGMDKKAFKDGRQLNVELKGGMC